MREIKFRLWIKKEKKYDYSRMAYSIPEFTSGFAYRKGEYFLEQYTGIKDKNGKDVYENDKVINMNGMEREVGYNPNRSQFGLYSRQLECWITNELLSHGVEIIGHIHE